MKIITTIIVVAMAILSISREFANPKGTGPINPKKAKLVFPSEFERKEIIIRSVPINIRANPKINNSFITTI